MDTLWSKIHFEILQYTWVRNEEARRLNMIIVIEEMIKRLQSLLEMIREDGEENEDEPIDDPTAPGP